MTSTIQIDKSSLNAAEEMDLLEKRLMNKLPDEESRNDFKRYIQLKDKSMIRSVNVDTPHEDNSIKDIAETDKHSSLPLDDKPLWEESSSLGAKAALSKRDQSNMLQETDAIIIDEKEDDCKRFKGESMKIGGALADMPHDDTGIQDQEENETTKLIQTEKEYSENHPSMPLEGKTREYADEQSSFHAKVRMIGNKDDALGENIPLLDPVSKNSKLDVSLPDEASRRGRRYWRYSCLRLTGYHILNSL